MLTNCQFNAGLNLMIYTQLIGEKGNVFLVELIRIRNVLNCLFFQLKLNDFVNQISY
jgi:hypothetical protein